MRKHNPTIKPIPTRTHRRLSLLIVAVVVLVLLSWWNTQTQIEKMLNHPPFSIEIGHTHLSLYLLVKALLLFIPLFWGGRLCLRTWEDKLNQISRLKENEKSLIMKVIQVICFLFCTLLGLDMLGIDLTALTLLGGAVSIGIGFGLQKISANFISGFILLMENSIKKGDYVALSADIKGHICRIHTRHTRIETESGHSIMVPNEYFITKPITNWTHHNTHGQLCCQFTLQHCEEQPSGDRFQQAVASYLSTLPHILATPTPCCFLDQYTQDTIQGRLCFWVADITISLHSVQAHTLAQLWEWGKKSPWTIKKLEMTH